MALLTYHVGTLAENQDCPGQTRTYSYLASTMIVGHLRVAFFGSLSCQIKQTKKGWGKEGGDRFKAWALVLLLSSGTSAYSSAKWECWQQLSRRVTVRLNEATCAANVQSCCPCFWEVTCLCLHPSGTKLVPDRASDILIASWKRVCTQ